jgi:hypothetical protein
MTKPPNAILTGGVGIAIKQPPHLRDATLGFRRGRCRRGLLMALTLGGNAINLGTHQSSETNYLDSRPANDGTVSVFCKAIDFERARIGLKLWLARGIFHDQVNLVGSKIDGDLNLGMTDRTWAKWGARGGIDLRDVSVGGLIADMGHSWPMPPKPPEAPKLRFPNDRPSCPPPKSPQPPEPPNLLLDGFTYSSLCWAPTEGECNAVLADRGDSTAAIKSFKTWLRNERTTQPYEQLASVLTKNGFYSEAATIQFESRNVESKASTGLRWIWLWVLWATIGYGYRPWLLAIWAGVLIYIGVHMLRASGVLKQYKFLEWAVFSTRSTYFFRSFVSMNGTTRRSTSKEV